jgi:hypothetical protein
MRTRTLRGRLLAAFESGTVEELAAAVAAIQLISTHHKNEPATPFTASPASQLFYTSSIPTIPRRETRANSQKPKLRNTHELLFT